MYTEGYMRSLLGSLLAAFGERLLYLGLQGSYARGEAGPGSDLDIVAVLDALQIEDLDVYKAAVPPTATPSCGFLCGKAELLGWNPLELFHLSQETEDYYGQLAPLLPPFCRADIVNSVKLAAGNLYHGLCHAYLHEPPDALEAGLGAWYKAACYILQDVHYLQTGNFIRAHGELCGHLEAGQGKMVLAQHLLLRRGHKAVTKEAFRLLFTWCQGDNKHGA